MKEFSNDLSTVTKKVSGFQGECIILHGVPGWGKTSFAAQMPKVLFMMSRDETGLKTLMRHGQVGETAHYPNPFETWNRIKTAWQELYVKNHDFKNFVIDTLTGVARICMESICQSKFGGDWEKFGDYGAGMKSVLPEWEQGLKILKKLAERMNVIALCHSHVKTMNNPKGPNYDRWIPMMQESMWGLTNGWADMVLFGDLETGITGAKDANKKGKATTGGKRLIRCSFHPAFDAKHRHGLPDTIFGGKNAKETYEKWRNELIKGKKAQTKKQNDEEDEEEENEEDREQDQENDQENETEKGGAEDEGEDESESEGAEEN